MRERDTPLDPQLLTLSHTPHCAGKVAQAVGGENRRPLERRHKKAARKMRLMMLDVVKLCLDLVRAGIERMRQSFRDRREPGVGMHAVPCKSRHAHGVEEFLD